MQSQSLWSIDIKFIFCEEGFYVTGYSEVKIKAHANRMRFHKILSNPSNYSSEFELGFNQTNC